MHGSNDDVFDDIQVSRDLPPLHCTELAGDGHDGFNTFTTMRFSTQYGLASSFCVLHSYFTQSSSRRVVRTKAAALDVRTVASRNKELIFRERKVTISDAPVFHVPDDPSAYLFLYHF